MNVSEQPGRRGVRMPMFPLGNVLFPNVVLPLRVFEPRYLALVRDCLASEPEFGVVLIERGAEVGGADVRFSSGTVARILAVRDLQDGTLLVTCAGTRRISITQWLPDDPYPLAEVVDWPDPADADEADTAAIVRRVRSVLGRSSEAGDPVAPATIELADDASSALWQACAVAPVSPLDDLALLRAPDAAERITLFGRMLDDLDHALSYRLGPR